MNRDADVLGIDIGGVIIAKRDGGDDTYFFSEHFQRTPPVGGAIEAIGRLARERFDRRVDLVSKAGPASEAKTRAWLAAHRFHEVTSVPKAHLHFCRERAEKAGICSKLGITHFVDDRLEVLGFLASVSHRYLFQADPAEACRFEHHLGEVRVVGSWAEVLRALI